MSDSLTQEYSFSSVEQLDEVQHAMGWCTEYRQLKPGPFSSSVSILECDDWFLLEEHTNCTMELRAPSMPGMVVIALLEGVPASVNGQMFSRDHVLIFPPDIEFRAAMPAGIKVPQLGVTAEAFESVCRAVAPRLSPLLGGDAHLIATTPGRLERLRGAMRAALFAPPNRVAAREEAVCEILTGILSLALDDGQMFSGQGLRRVASGRALDRAIEYIDAHLNEAISIASLGHRLGTTTRSLERIFVRELGVSPQQYVKARRLNAVYRCLRGADKEEGLRVIDVATSFGFAHMGRFAGDYHRHFGEYPRETLLGS
jgi:AraC-like DNA-binding protein